MNDPYLFIKWWMKNGSVVGAVH